MPRTTARWLPSLLLTAALPAQSWQPLTPTTSPTPRLHAAPAHKWLRGEINAVAQEITEELQQFRATQSASTV